MQKYNCILQMVTTYLKMIEHMHTVNILRIKNIVVIQITSIIPFFAL